MQTRADIAQKWAQCHDITLHANIVETEGIGLNSSNNDEIPTLIVKVPRNLVLTQDTVSDFAGKTPELSRWLSQDHIQGVGRLHRLLLFLAVSLQRASPGKFSDWDGYILSLPKHVGLPCSWPLSKIESLLAHTSIFEPALSTRLTLERAHRKFCEALEVTETDVPLHLWILVYEWVLSRGLTHPLTGETCMVPIIDICNHSSTHPNVRYDIDEEGSFILLPYPTNTQSNLVDSSLQRTGEKELSLNYGITGSAESLYNYGFIAGDMFSGYDELRKPFDPLSDDIRAVIDPSRASSGLLSQEAEELGFAYEALVEFFHRPLHLLKLDTNGDWECEFILLLACRDYLELQPVGDGYGLFVGNTELEPGSVARSLNKEVLQEVGGHASTLVAHLARYFLNCLHIAHLQEKDGAVHSDEDTVNVLAKNEARIYSSFLV